MSKNFWIISRPKRKLTIVPEMLKVFATVAIGEQWTGNREIQRLFEQELVKFGWKAQNLSRDGSGSRTYAALLRLLGLWYEDEGGVQLTQAGKEMVSGEPAVPQLTKQLINLQYPSPYSRRVNIDESFRVQPHRFVINILSTPGVERLTQQEIAYCIVPFAKSMGDLDDCVRRIMEYRGVTDSIRAQAIMTAGTSAKNLENVANTVINQLEYTGFFKYRDKANAPLEFEDGGQGRARKFIDEYGRGLANADSDEVTFQIRYGSGINVSKDYSRTNPIQPSINPTDKLVLLKFYETAQVRPILGISDELITEISQSTGVNPIQVQSVLSKIANQPLLDSFEERYINLSKGGTETATEFEKVTTNVLGQDGFGLDAEWVGSRGAYPDIFVYIDKDNLIHGIIDTKAYKKYTLNIDQRNKMAHTYIPRFKEVEHKEKVYHCGFFAYIAGGFGPNIQANFETLRIEAGAKNGSYVTSYDLMQLLRRHRAKAFSNSELIEVFSSNKQIFYDRVG